MADQKISQLPAASTITGTELVPVVQSGTTSQTTVEGLFTLLGFNTTHLNQIPYSVGPNTTSYVPAPSVANTFLEWNGAGYQWSSSTATGTVTSVSIASANGFAGTVANPTTTPAITLETTVTGILKGNGTGVSAATAGTDYVIPSGSITGNAATATVATNIASGLANEIPYQTGSGTTSFIAAPTVASTFLEWNGTNFVWGSGGGGGSGTVTSVGLAMPADYTVTNSPVTTTGTLTATRNSQSANLFLASPNGTAGVPSYRAIVAADVPTLNQNTTGNAATATTATAAHGLNSATTTVVVNGATAPTAGQVLTATSSTAANWQTPSGGSSVINGYINGFTLSNDGTTPNTVLDIAAGYASDSANAVMITGTAFTKNTTGTFVAGTGNAGMGTGLTIAASTWYHVFAIIHSGSYDVYFDTSTTAANAPAGTTAHRYVGSFFTDASANILAFTQKGQKFLWAVIITNLSTSSPSTTGALVTVSTPLGFEVDAILWLTNLAAAAGDTLWTYPASFGGLQSGANIRSYVTSPATQGSGTTLTNTSSQIKYQANTGDSIVIYSIGYINPHVAPVF